jgi:hypothetical protein
MNFFLTFIKRLVFIFFNLFFSFFNTNRVFILINNNSYTYDVELELIRRASFFFKNNPIEIVVIKTNKLFIIKYFFNPNIKLIYGFSFKNSFVKKNQDNLLFFDIDYNHNHDDGWQWHKALSIYNYKKSLINKTLEESYLRLKNSLLIFPKFDKAYIIATGPSLSKAAEIDWTDGYRIVCNTIVKDPIIWKHINPHFIVAGDAIYHFGTNDFAISFIEDLKNRLRESNTFFIYPLLFHAYVCNVLQEFKDRLIPIPTVNRESIHISLLKDFRLPDAIGNVLNLLLLPIATTLSRNVFLYGFDGRAPDDKLFWSNSSKHTYTDKLIEIIKQHPKFFEEHVPKHGESNYVNNVHGNRLERILILAEESGWHFNMMHKSWTETLNKRYKEM